jgi:hypothetical protein
VKITVPYCFHARIPVPEAGKRHSRWGSASLGSLFIFLFTVREKIKLQTPVLFSVTDELRECLLFLTTAHSGFICQTYLKKHIKMTK